MNLSNIIAVLLHCAKLVDVFDLNILHVKDFNCKFEEGPNEVGGISRIIHYVKSARRATENGEAPPVLVLVSGNFFGQTIWYSVHRWRIALDFLNLLEPDAMSLGDHEFNDGPLELQNFLAELNTPVIGTNLEIESSLRIKGLIRKSVTLNVAGKNILILGYTEKGRSLTHGVNFGNQTTLEDYCLKINKTSVDFVIAIAHSSVSLDGRTEIEPNCVQVIVGNGSIVRDGQYIGKLKLRFTTDNKLEDIQSEDVHMDRKVPKDRSSMEVLMRYTEMLEKLETHTLGKTLTTLDGSTCNVSECSLGNLIADAFCDFKARAERGLEWTSAAIAILNSGAIRNTHNMTKDGKFISEAFLYKALPYQSQLMTIRVPGTTLLTAVKHSFMAQGNAFLQVAGLRILYNTSTTPHNISVMVRCAECEVPAYSRLREDRDYDLVTTKYIVDGGDGYDMFSENISYFQTEPLNSLQATMTYIKNYKKVIGQVEGRLVIYSNDTRTLEIYIFCYLLLYFITFLLK